VVAKQGHIPAVAKVTETSWALQGAQLPPPWAGWELPQPIRGLLHCLHLEERHVGQAGGKEQGRASPGHPGASLSLLA
jgi:hypothetical protein